MKKATLIYKVCEGILRERYRLEDFTFNILDITKELKWAEEVSSGKFVGSYYDGELHRCLVEVHPVNNRSYLTVITKGSGYIPEVLNCSEGEFLFIPMPSEFYLFLDRTPTNFRLIRCKFEENGGGK